MDTSTVHPLKLFDLAKSQRRLVYASAPMVRYSKLAFRQTVHAYGTDLCWTPMSLAKEFNRSQVARDSDFTLSTNGTQPPTIFQFGANVPVELSRASSLVAPYVSGVDINCGCPQSWACAETLGAALMEKRELVRDMVVETRRQLQQDGWDVGKESAIDSPKGRSVSVKIRIHKDLRKTVDWITTVLGPEHDRNIDFLTIHPRLRSTPSTTPINVEALEILTSTFGDKLPILVSGDVFTLSSLPYTSPLHTTATITDSTLPRAINGQAAAEDSPESPERGLAIHIPKLAGLMSARAILANPGLFAGHEACTWGVVETFMNKVARAPIPYKLTLHHLTQMCGPGLALDKSSLLNKQERKALMACEDMVELIDFLDDKIAQHTGAEGLRRDAWSVQPG